MEIFPPEYIVLERPLMRSEVLTCFDNWPTRICDFLNIFVGPKIKNALNNSFKAFFVLFKITLRRGREQMLIIY